MLEECPVCAAKVLFTTNICPRCQVDKTNPPPAKLVDWTLQNTRVKTEQEAAKAPRKRNVRFSVGMMLIAGGWLVIRSAYENSHYIRSMGFSHSPMIGVTIGVLMNLAGAVVLFLSIFWRGR